MAKLKYSMWFNNTVGDTTALTNSNVMSVSADYGRQWAVDPYSPGTMTVVVRVAGGNLPQLGSPIAVQLNEAGNNFPTTGETVFGGFVKDIAIDYGNTTAMDFATIVVEGTLSRWGRRQFTSRSLAQNRTLTQLSNLATAIGFNTFCFFNGTGESTASAQTYVGNGLDLVNVVMATEMGKIRESCYISYTTPYIISPFVSFYKRQYDTTVGQTFTDTTTAAGIRYEKINFTSATQRFYNEVTINPLGLASQTAGSGDYNLTQDSVDYTTAQALSHAQYLVSQYNSLSMTPYSVVCTYANQDTATRQNNFNFVNTTGFGPGDLIKIEHRGNTYFAVVEGKSIAIDQQETQVEIFFSPFDNNNYLILNNATFGTLGTSGTYPGNKLGF